MKKLFLASYFAGVADLLPDFVKEDLTGKKVIFIPTAGLHEMSAQDRAALDEINASDRAALQKHGLIVDELEISSAPSEVIKNSIQNADCIFICGGNTFLLLQELRRTGAFQLIYDHIENGKLYMGTSAGSVVMQRDIIADGVDDPKFGPELNGNFFSFGFIDFYLYVHYGSHYWGNDDEYIRKYYSKLNYIKLTDKQAVAVFGDKVEIVTAP